MIRDERADDIPAIRGIVDAAFEAVPHSNRTEAAIIDILRESRAMVISLVAI